MTFCNPETAHCLHIVKRRDTARKSILPAKNRAGGWKILTNEKLEINISECIFTLLTSMIFTCWSARKSTLHPHFDYLAHRLRVFYTAFPGFFRSKKGILTHPKKIQVVMFQDVTQITIIPLYDSDSRCRDFYASHADLKTQFIADFVPKNQNIKMSVIDVTGE